MSQLRFLRKSASLAPFLMLASMSASAQPCYNGGYCPPPPPPPGYYPAGGPCGGPGMPPCGGPYGGIFSLGQADMILNMVEQYSSQVGSAQAYLRNAIQPGSATCTGAAAVLLRHRQLGVIGLGPMEATQIRSCLLQSLAIAASSLQGLPLDTKQQAAQEFLDVINSLKSDDDLNFLSEGADPLDVFRANISTQVKTLLDTCLQVAHDTTIEPWRRTSFASIVLNFVDNALAILNGGGTAFPPPGVPPMPGFYAPGLSVPLVDVATLQNYQQQAQAALNPS